jgi:hypothetical protein
MTNEEKILLIATRLAAIDYPDMSSKTEGLQAQIINRYKKTAVGIMPMFFDEFKAGWTGATAFAVLKVKGEKTIGRSFTDRASYRGLFGPRGGGAITGVLKSIPVIKEAENSEYGEVVEAMNNVADAATVNKGEPCPNDGACLGKCQDEYCEKW